jgi:hypothetical protein
MYFIDAFLWIDLNGDGIFDEAFRKVRKAKRHGDRPRQRFDEVSGLKFDRRDK